MSPRRRSTILADAFARIHRHQLSWRNPVLPQSDTVGSWRDDAEVAPIKDEALPALVMPNGTRIYPRWLDTRNGWLMPESWD